MPHHPRGHLPGPGSDGAARLKPRPAGAGEDQAAEQSAAQSTIAPLRTFLQYWGEFVAVQRVPARAARLRELESIADGASDRAVLDAAVAEIQQILAIASREAAA